ncbi:hypothetical protein [Loktanella salsilacus]|uniref:hypothetical protein n=1 Tax=Loktanella salsilacus TaxID=195913 RepID=UPI00356433B1
MTFTKIAASAAAAIALLAAPVMAQDKPVVGLVMKSLANEFFQNMMEGAGQQ